jgi:methyltransferase (TIGR00027 family)
MRKTQSSLTAQGIAIVRALESERPAETRICYDPYARQFADSFLYGFAKFFDKLGYSEMRGPGVMGFLTVRESHIDAYLQKCLAGGLEQLVILGAGFDARAYRFAEQLHGVTVFEVDHPATQQVKVAKVQRILGSLPAHVVYVPVDFNTQTLAERLQAAGYSSQRKTLFVWQGVTQYLTPEAVDDTLAFVATESGPGSAIIFDYMYTTLLDGTVRRGEVSTMRRNRWLSGEFLRFGIAEGTIGAFMEQRGYCRVQNADGRFLHKTYFTGPKARRTVADGYAIVSAEVAEKEIL